MIHAYHLLICFFLIVSQTTILAGSGGPANLYDLLAPFVVYLGVHRSLKEAIPIILFGGLAMDGISGGVFGIHLTAYLWMYIGVRWAVQFLHVGNAILLPLLVTAGVAFESLVVAFVAVVLASSAWPIEFMFTVVAGQVMWGAITGPLLMLLFIYGQKIVVGAHMSMFSVKDQLRNP